MTPTHVASAPERPGPPPVADPLRRRVVADAENRPGVYRFLGPRGEVLYVGKSIRIRTRLLSYFRPGGSTKQTELLRVAKSVEWGYVPNEFEALLREFRLIRAFQPRFNRRHRLERRYAWIRLTPGDAPRLAATRSPRADGSRYFGPFPAPRRLPDLLRELAGLVGLRDCPDRTPMRFADQMDFFDRGDEPGCPRADFGTCPAPCAALCSIADYRGNVDATVSFLRGTSDTPLDELDARIRRASERREFELARGLRDRSERLRTLRDGLVALRDELADLSFVYRIESPGEDPDRGYVLRWGRVLMSFDFEGDGTLSPPVRERAAALLKRPAPAPEELDAEACEEIFLVARWFRANPSRLRNNTGAERGGVLP